MKADLQKQIERIEKATILIQSGLVESAGSGRWLVRSQSKASASYTVTAEHCECYDSRLSGNVCKHRWAACGAIAAMLISEIESAKTITELENTGLIYSGPMMEMGEAFASVARAMYRRRHCELTGCSFDHTNHSNNAPSAPAATRSAQRTSSREAEARAILVKPQPRSLGRINGIEI
jgi:hypothetical protein